jgi:hypothetical protein
MGNKGVNALQSLSWGIPTIQILQLADWAMENLKILGLT